MSFSVPVHRLCERHGLVLGWEYAKVKQQGRSMTHTQAHHSHTVQQHSGWPSLFMASRVETLLIWFDCNHFLDLEVLVRIRRRLFKTEMQNIIFYLNNESLEL